MVYFQPFSTPPGEKLGAITTPFLHIPQVALLHVTLADEDWEGRRGGNKNNDSLEELTEAGSQSFVETTNTCSKSCRQICVLHIT